MCPGDVVVRLLYSASSGRIIEHDFAIADVAMAVNLPEDGGARPVFGSTDQVGVDEMSDG